MGKYDLKDLYEAARGQPISRRQWRAIFNSLQLDCLLNPEEAVYAAGWLRRVSPKTRLDLQTVLAVKEFQAVLPLDCSMTRRDLWAVTRGRLNPHPSIATVYRWASELGYNQHQNWGDPDNHWLNPEDIRLWVLKLISWKTKPHGNNSANCRSAQHFARNRSAKAA